MNEKMKEKSHRHMGSTCTGEGGKGELSLEYENIQVTWAKSTYAERELQRGPDNSQKYPLFGLELLPDGADFSLSFW